MEELQIAGRALEKSLNVDKMNYCCYGNGDPHIHWHLIPRYKSDRDWGELPYFKLGHPKDHQISVEQAGELASLIRNNL